MAHKHGFKSKAQWKYCFATQARHPGWNCRKEAHYTPSYHALPARKGVHVRTLRKLL